jgi:hypothetical protein
MAAALERAGLTPDKLAQIAAQGAEAHRAVVVDKSIVDYPDHAVRHRYLETIVRLAGLEPTIDTTITSDSYESLVAGMIQPVDCIDVAVTESLPIENSSTIIQEIPAQISADKDCILFEAEIDID